MGSRRTIVTRLRERRRRLTCSELVELVTDYLEDALDASERARFDSHLDSCARCSSHVEQMRCTLRALGTIPPAELDPRAVRELTRAFESWHQSRPLRRVEGAEAP